MVNYFRQFYVYYPQIRDSLNPEFKAVPVIAKIALPEIRDSAHPELNKDVLKLDGCLLVERLSFTHFVKLLQIESPLKRLFYEVESIRGHWSVNELKRQIATQYFERSGLSLDKKRWQN